MNKAELVAVVRAAHGNNLTAREAVEAVVDAIACGVIVDGHVGLAGFGTFEAVARAPRRMRSPSTGLVVNAPARRAPAFTASPRLRDAVDSGIVPPLPITARASS